MHHSATLTAICFAGAMLFGCAADPMAPASADAAKPAGLEEKQVDDIKVVAGTWKGRMHRGPYKMRAMEVTMQPDGSWTNKVEGVGEFRGTARVANGNIQAKSTTTNTGYVVRLYEGSDKGAKKRVLVWLLDFNQAHFATTEFVR